MPRRATYDAVLDAIYGAAADPESRPLALSALADHVGGRGAMLVSNVPAGRGGVILTVGLREDLNQLYLQRHTANPTARSLAKLPSGRPALISSIVDPTELRRTEFHADMLAPQKIHDIVALTYAGFAPSGAAGGISVTLSAAQADRADAALRRMTRLSPHLTRALDLSLTLAANAHAGRDLVQALDLMPGAALLLEEGGRIAHANADAEALLQQQDGLIAVVGDGLRLAAALPAESRILARRIAQALSMSAGGDDSIAGPLHLTRPSGRQQLLVQIFLLPRSAFPFWENVVGARALMLVIDPEAPIRAAAHTLRTAFGLTVAEARVAAMVASGLGVPELAAALGVSVNTIKTHLASCFGKTGAHSQARLARLLAAIPVSPSRD